MHKPLKPTTKYQGVWFPGKTSPEQGNDAVAQAILNVSRPVYLLDCNGGIGVAQDGRLSIGGNGEHASGGLPVREVNRDNESTLQRQVQFLFNARQTAGRHLVFLLGFR